MERMCGEKSVVGLLLPPSSHRIICLQVLGHRITELENYLRKRMGIEKKHT